LQILQRPASSFFPPPLIVRVCWKADWAAYCGLHTMLRNEHMVAFPLTINYSLVTSCSLLLFSPPFTSIKDCCCNLRASPALYPENRPRRYSTYVAAIDRPTTMPGGSGSGGIDSLNAHEEAAASSCKSRCIPTPLTTVYTPPASCTDNWTPVKLYSTYAGSAVSLIGT